MQKEIQGGKKPALPRICPVRCVCVIWVMTKQVKLTIKCNPSTPTRYMLNGEIVTGCTFVAQMLRDDLSGPCEIFFLVNDSSNHLSPAGTNVQEYEQ